MGAFQTDTELAAGDNGRFDGVLSKDWDILGPNGGYMAALVLRACGQAAPPDHRPLSLSCQYLDRAAAGPVVIALDVEKSGREAWSFSATMRQGDRLVLKAQVWTGNMAEGPESVDWTLPDAPAPEDLRPLDPGGSGFLRNFDTRSVTPVGRADPRGSVYEAWIRYPDFAGDGDGVLEQARALPWIDAAPWMAHRRGEGELDYYPSSLDLSVWFHQPSNGAEWLFAQSVIGHAGRGVLSGHVRMWTREGRLVASGASNLLCRRVRRP
jgi:acyl-CoA thioesterase